MFRTYISLIFIGLSVSPYLSSCFIQTKNHWTDFLPDNHIALIQLNTPKQLEEQTNNLGVGKHGEGFKFNQRPLGTGLLNYIAGSQLLRIGTKSAQKAFDYSKPVWIAVEDATDGKNGFEISGLVILSAKDPSFADELLSKYQEKDNKKIYGYRVFSSIVVIGFGEQKLDKNEYPSEDPHPPLLDEKKEAGIYASINLKETASQKIITQWIEKITSFFPNIEKKPNWTNILVKNLISKGETFHLSLTYNEISGLVLKTRIHFEEGHPELFSLPSLNDDAIKKIDPQASISFALSDDFFKIKSVGMKSIGKSIGIDQYSGLNSYLKNWSSTLAPPFISNVFFSEKLTKDKKNTRKTIDNIINQLPIDIHTISGYTDKQTYEEEKLYCETSTKNILDNTIEDGFEPSPIYKNAHKGSKINSTECLIKWPIPSAFQSITNFFIPEEDYENINLNLIFQESTEGRWRHNSFHLKQGAHYTLCCRPKHFQAYDNYFVLDAIKDGTFPKDLVATAHFSPVRLMIGLDKLPLGTEIETLKNFFFSGRLQKLADINLGIYLGIGYTEEDRSWEAIVVVRPGELQGLSHIFSTLIKLLPSSL